MAEYYGATGGGKYLGGSKNGVGWDIGAGSARTAGGTQIAAPAPSIGWDIGAGADRTTGGSYAAPAPTYAQPAPSTMSYSSAPSRAISPVSDYQPPAQSFAPPPPPPPPAPPVGGRQWYNSLSADQQQAENQKWLGGDSDYTAQASEFDRALQTFIDRIANQKKGFETDANDATASTGRNQALSLDSLGEDFGARGLSYSGMFSNEKDRTNTRFNEAKGNIGKVLARNNQDADNRLADYTTENKISKDNASRASLSRQAQRQALLDSSAGL